MTFFYVYIKNLWKEFAGKITSLIDSDIIVLEDKNENISYIPISDTSIITDRR